MGPKALATAADDVGPAVILEMLKKCESPAQIARLCAKFGGAKRFQAELAKVGHANELEGRAWPAPAPAPTQKPEEPEQNHTPGEPEQNHTPAEPEQNHAPAEPEQEPVPI